MTITHADMMYEGPIFAVGGFTTGLTTLSNSCGASSGETQAAFVAIYDHSSTNVDPIRVFKVEQVQKPDATYVPIVGILDLKVQP